jgi:hypothetical protein
MRSGSGGRRTETENDGEEDGLGGEAHQEAVGVGVRARRSRCRRNFGEGALAIVEDVDEERVAGGASLLDSSRGDDKDSEADRSLHSTQLEEVHVDGFVGGR